MWEPFSVETFRTPCRDLNRDGPMPRVRPFQRETLPNKIESY